MELARKQPKKSGNILNWVKIGNQNWMSQNLNVKPGYFSGKSWCYENDLTACAKYGMLYDFKAAQDVCPDGWRLPSDKDWRELIEKNNPEWKDLYTEIIGDGSSGQARG